ncbi:hypothetical protein ECG_02440 [Echinococcus granulosus]|uniref:Uncharacterized protein n=1 Tax=Echinococcus granulosus TaxID=6210 RepID=W6V5D6_ECHGR|nr:hypothetical protein EGR_03764 [Echinococcus granulosus]EUB61474.1 hypothetical protein EGR_03764 [Echinococcus granulosus]KAH9284024.1 hypothetical protein ECG_02444 [Echinococcus granulosus]KAH9284028.1 hypothetical protein ECG_02440 [Echinococcus granulosus]
MATITITNAEPGGARPTQFVPGILTHPFATIRCLDESRELCCGADKIAVRDYTNGGGGDIEMAAERLWRVGDAPSLTTSHGFHFIHGSRQYPPTLYVVLFILLAFGLSYLPIKAIVGTKCCVRNDTS